MSTYGSISFMLLFCTDKLHNNRFIIHSTNISYWKNILFHRGIVKRSSTIGLLLPAHLSDSDIYITPPSRPFFFLPSLFQTCCAILPTSFEGKGPHLKRLLIAQPLHQTDSQLRFSGVFLSFKGNTKRSVHSPQDHFISPLSFATTRLT